MPRIDTFDDWVDLFRQWRDDIGLDEDLIKEFRFEALYGELPTNEVEFGDFVGRRKFEKIKEIPDQRIRDALLNLIVYQGDTEFASVEQQRKLCESPPSETDLRSLLRVMCEEMRHGYQMCHLLIEHFGSSGKVEAIKLLERRAFEQNRLLGSFNERVDHWLDFFVYTEFIDRDGKFQLVMLSHSAFAPLARSTLPMLKEESYHLGTGHNGLKRILRAEKMPVSIIQKYINKWVPTAYDLFGNDHSSSAHWSYVWGLKGRFDEGQTEEQADRERLNEASRKLYIQEVEGLIKSLNAHIPDDKQKLIVPSVKFNRSIGEHAHKKFDIEGNKVADDEWDDYMQQVFPTDADRSRITEIFKEKDWIELRKG